MHVLASINTAFTSTHNRTYNLKYVVLTGTQDGMFNMTIDTEMGKCLIKVHVAKSL